MEKVLDVSKFKIIPIGGFGEYGKNMAAYEYKDKILLIDCGIMFPEEEMLGIDFVIPDTRFLEDNKDKIVGMVFTHGHEDHIGGVPYIWPKIKCPMYATNLTSGLIEVKIKEFNITDAKITLFKAGDILKIGPFEVEAFHVTHSIPDSVGLAIKTDEGLIIHATDYKFDYTPISGQKMDVGKLALLGEKGVLALLSDSTNIDVPGYTISESAIIETFDQIFKNSPGRIIVSSFASLINRIQLVMNVAYKYHRKVAISGRSMENNIQIAKDLGYLKIPEGIIVDNRKIGHFLDTELVILCTGSQGEEYSALVRMASGEHRQIKIKKGDTVIISASAIPGNEGSIHGVIDNLSRLGANVIYGKKVDIHVSGHASAEELKLMIALTKPKYFIPIHGVYRALVSHAKLAQRMGIPYDNTLVVENGNIIEFYQGKGAISNSRVPSGYVLVDGLGVGDVGNIVLRDRQAMAKDGIFVAILTVDHRTGQIVTSPDIISRGFVYMRAAEDLIHGARAEIKKMFAHHNQKFPLNWEYIKKAIREEMGEFLYLKTQRRPMVIPVIIEV
jgi:ribonuclease J